MIDVCKPNLEVLNKLEEKTWQSEHQAKLLKIPLVVERQCEIVYVANATDVLNI